MTPPASMPCRACIPHGLTNKQNNFTLCFWMSRKCLKDTTACHYNPLLIRNHSKWWTENELKIQRKLEARFFLFFSWSYFHKRHGLRTPNEAFFHRSPKLLGLDRQFWADKFWDIWGIFGRFNSTHFGTVSPSVPCPCFLLVNQYFYKKLSLYIQIPNIYLGPKESGI